METLLGVLLVVVGFLNIPFRAPELTPGNVLMPVWLGLYGMFFLCAPIYSYLALRSLARSPAAGSAPKSAAPGVVYGGRPAPSQRPLSTGAWSARGAARGTAHE